MNIFFLLNLFLKSKQMEQVDAEFMEKEHIQFISTIGKGGYGIIYEVYLPQYQQTFALKRIPTEKFNATEVECMIAITSTSIVPLYYYYHYKQNTYLLMEYCPNSIDKLISNAQKRDDPIPSDKMYSLARGMATSLYDCHQRHIVHGDVKPSNFLIDKYGRVKICDFGLSHMKSDDEKDSNYAGTLLFIAPEILKRKPFDAYKADIWSLGISLYVLASNGLSPWSSTNPSEVAKEIFSGNYNDGFISDIKFKKIIRLCLNPDPAKRPSAYEVAEMLTFDEPILLAETNSKALCKSKGLFRPSSLGHFNLNSSGRICIPKRHHAKAHRHSFLN